MSSSRKSVTGRNDFSAEAIAAALESPDHYPVAVVAELLAELKASGDYDRILAEAKVVEAPP